MVDAGIVVIRTAQQHDAEAVFALQLFQHFAGRAAHGDVVEVIPARGSPASTARLFSSGDEAQDVLELLVHLAFEEVRLGEVDEGIQEPDALFLEQVAFLDERRLDGLRRGGDGRDRCGWPARAQSGLVRQSIIGKKMMSSGFLACTTIQQVVHVRDAELAGEAGVDGAALGAFLVQLLAGVIARRRCSRP